MKGTDLAPEGTVWVCGACGKRSLSRYGFDAENNATSISPGWDVSCSTWAVLCQANPVPDFTIGESWAAVEPQPEREV